MVPFARRLRACLRENVEAASAMKPAAAAAASAMPTAFPLWPVGASRLNREGVKQHVQLQLYRFAGCQRVGLASRGIAVASQFHALRQVGFQSHLVPSDGRVVA